MHPFTLVRPGGLDAALAAAQDGRATYIAGGTDLIQLGKDDVQAPDTLVDLDGLPLDDIAVRDGMLRIGALARMTDVAAHPALRAGWPAISEALLLSASPQIRNMGTAGGNLLQRTRCLYFRDTGFDCNKRKPGSGCPAIAGQNRSLAVLGGSEHCIATHPSDMPVVLMAMDASLELLQPGGGRRTVPLAEFYRLPGDTPNIETNLLPGELIAAIVVPASAAAQRSRYVKVRDRATFEFAVVSAAVALDIQGGTVRDARVAMGGVGPRPWRLPQVEAALAGKPATEATWQAASAVAADTAKPASQNAFKLKLMQNTVRRALQLASA